MKIKILCLDPVKSKELASLVSEYESRLKHYCRLEIKELKSLRQKKIALPDLMRKEAELFTNELTPSDFIVVLDEKGTLFSSLGFSELLQQKMNQATNQICLIIGGAFGIAPGLKDRAHLILSLSPMTFTHDMARVLLMEQIYRAFTIIKGEKYHNE